MRSEFFKICFLVTTLFLFSCSEQNEVKQNNRSPLKIDTTIKYAKGFAIARGDGFTVVYIFGNRNNNDTTSTFILYKDSLPKNFPSSDYQLKIPCKKVAALSSIYATMFCELGAEASLVAIDNIDYVNNTYILDKHKAGQLKELARMPQIDIEQTMILNPDIIFTFGMGEGEKDLDKKLIQTKIPVAVSIDHLEETPLARAEWIKFFAAFADKSERADSIFREVELNYLHLKKLAAETSPRPTVFSEIKYSDSWFMPGGNSFMARLLKDAGANYLWKDNDKTGSLPLSFEQVYAKAIHADYWINLSTVKTKKELLGFESRYEEFDAFKNGRLFNNNKVCNDKGYSNYWETGMIYPDRILSDLILIFHPELKSELKNDLYYYIQLK